MSFWSESDFIPGIHLLFLFLLLCSCAPVTPFHSKHVFTHIYWLLFWLSSALHSPACRAWSACARSSPFSLLLKQMLCSVLRLVSLFKHHWASDSGLHGSTKEHLCIFFPRMNQNAWNISTERRCQGGGVLLPVLSVSASALLIGGDGAYLL